MRRNRLIFTDASTEEADIIKVSLSSFGESQNLYRVRGQFQDMLGFRTSRGGDADTEAHNFNWPAMWESVPIASITPSSTGTVDMDVLEVQAARHGVDLHRLLVFSLLP